MRGTRLRGDLTLFADDSNTRMVLEPNSSLRDEAAKLARDDECFDEVMAAGGWKQNKSKADILPNLGGASLKPFAAVAKQAGAEVIASRVTYRARHLGGVATFNNSTFREIEARKAAMRSGWSQLGSFWTSRCRMTTKRSALLSMVVEAGLSGLTAFAPTFTQLSSLTARLCKYLRVLEEGKDRGLHT